KDQESIVDDYLKNAYLPALHRNNIKLVGVFKPIGNDTAADRRIYVLVPYKSLEQFTELQTKLDKDKAYNEAGSAYINAPYNKPVYKRMETMLLRAFEGMATLAKPALDNTREDNVYEMRSYEGHTEKIYRNKVEMFNKGDEIGLFNRLQFNAVFYGEVIAGAKMPNLMYMTSFNSMQARDEHWKTFGADPQWKKLSADPNYQNNVSKNEITFLRATEFSDL
ncbi:MAG TPA: NIPSNAP family protein, partial [Flavisolibacter sp.]|nr:NIPSNAP family protein [Flavisolibacter sp.]